MSRSLSVFNAARVPLDRDGTDRCLGRSGQGGKRPSDSGREGWAVVGQGDPEQEAGPATAPSGGKKTTRCITPTTGGVAVHAAAVPHACRADRAPLGGRPNDRRDPSKRASRARRHRGRSVRRRRGPRIGRRRRRGAPGAPRVARPGGQRGEPLARPSRHGRRSVGRRRRARHEAPADGGRAVAGPHPVDSGRRPTGRVRGRRRRRAGTAAAARRAVLQGRGGHAPDVPGVRGHRPRRPARRHRLARRRTQRRADRADRDGVLAARGARTSPRAQCCRRRSSSRSCGVSTTTT